MEFELNFEKKSFSLGFVFSLLKNLEYRITEHPKKILAQKYRVIYKYEIVFSFQN